MDDLLGLDWKNSKNPPKSSTLAFSKLQSPPNSGRSTPNIARPPSAQPSIKIGTKPSTPHDSFANLLGGGTRQTSSPSLQERQRRLQEEQAKKAQDYGKGINTRLLSQQDSFWDGLAGQDKSLTGGPKLPPVSRNGVGPSTTSAKINDDDLLAGFSSSAPINAASHFPPSSQGQSETGNKIEFQDDDDPFGLGHLPSRPVASQTEEARNNDHDDILGMLGRPVEEVVAFTKRESICESDDEPPQLNHLDKAVAELVDMGFPSEKAVIALASTDSGTDVQAAVGILLNQAHDESNHRARKKTDAPDNGASKSSRGIESSMRRFGEDPVPPWMKNQEDSSRSSSQTREGSTRKEKDVTKLASDIGTSIFKSANSLWQTGQKKVQRAMADFQQDGDSNQPKWMREVQLSGKSPSGPALPERKAPIVKPSNGNVTDEALMLEAGGGRPETRTQTASAQGRAKQEQFDDPKIRKSTPINRNMTPSPSLSTGRSASRLTRDDFDSDDSQAYISPARRRKPQISPNQSLLGEPTQATAPVRGKSPLSSPPVQSNNPFAGMMSTTRPKASSPAPLPKAPPRRVPPASSVAISLSASHRKSGTEAFKRGDHTLAQASYTKALEQLPSSHPINIVIFCNRALTSIKLGDAKAAVVDANSALEVIGISRGEGEKIDLGASEGEKEMKEFYGKALMRKAEALEHLEKWQEAAKAWRDAVEAGVGGSVSIQGRNRCEKAAGGGSSTTQLPSQPITRGKSNPAAKPRTLAVNSLAAKRPSVNHAASAEAVRKLRAANAAADKADDEKFALMDTVDAKLVAWKGTKSDNLRALLGSLDKVLWEGAGWSKVGMQDLVMPNRVKIIYMKAIAKVHPDKVGIVYIYTRSSI
jgi:hypothetical protein